MKRMLIVLLLFPLIATARKTKTSKDTPVFLRFGYLHTALLGNTHAYRNNNFYYGQGLNGQGVNMSVAIPIKGRWYVGLNYEPTSMLILADRVSNQAYDIFGDNNHYTNIRDMDVAEVIGLHQISLEGAYLFKTKYIEVMPTIKSGLLIYGGSDEIMNFSRKRKNSNYTEDVRVERSRVSPATIFWCAGIRVNKRFGRTFGFTGGVFYTGAPALNVGYVTKTTDFLGSSWELDAVEYKQPFQVFQFQLGIELHIWKGKRKEAKKLSGDEKK